MSPLDRHPRPVVGGDVAVVPGERVARPDVLWDDLDPDVRVVEGLILADGSGLSRDNRCTARQLTATLVAMNAHPNGAMFRDPLTIGGVDGSLRKRLRDDRPSRSRKTSP